MNGDKPLWIAEQVLGACQGLEQPVIACLGLAYKADVGDLRESPAIAVIERLQNAVAGELLVVEPHVEALPPELSGKPRTDLVSLETALDSSQVVLLLTDYHEFRDVDPHLLADKRLIDTRGIWRDQASR